MPHECTARDVSHPKPWDSILQRAKSLAAPVFSLALAATAQAQCWVTYDAGLGTLPTCQGFTAWSADNPPSPTVVAGRLHIGPTTQSQMSYYLRDDFALDFAAGFAMEAELEIAASDCAQAGGNPWPRYGVEFAATDDAGRWVIVQLCSNTIELANHPYLGVDGVSVKTLGYPVQGSPLALRLDASASGFELRVNNVLQLSVPLGSVLFPANAGNLWFGDGTAWAGADMHISRVRATGVVLHTYGTAKVNSQGCTPSIGSTGQASVSSASPFDVNAVNVINNKAGILFYGCAPAAVAFQGGYKLVAAPTVRTPVQYSNGNAPPDDCSGAFSFDFNAHIQSGVDPNLTDGATVYCQYWHRDPASPSTTGLTDALAFSICP